MSFQEVTHMHPALTLHMVACVPLSIISSLSRPGLTLPWTSAYWEYFLLLDLLLWNFSCLLLSFFYLCHFSFSPSLCVVITISSPFYFTSFSCLSLPSEKEMAFWSSILAWKIPWTEEPGGIQSIESQRIGHDLATKPPPPFCVYFLPCLLELILHRYT